LIRLGVGKNKRNNPCVESKDASVVLSRNGKST
jgi:hypothetical protein